MDRIKYLITGVVIISLSSCAQNKYIDIQTSELKHSSPNVLSLYEKENKERRNAHRSGGFLSWLLDGMVGSDPDEFDDLYSRNHDNGNRSAERKEQFVSENGESLRSKLEAKKQ
jgi:hypothetical protein